MLNNVDGKGFFFAIKEFTKMVLGFKPLLWFLAMVLALSLAGDFYLELKRLGVTQPATQQIYSPANIHKDHAKPLIERNG